MDVVKQLRGGFVLEITRKPLASSDRADQQTFVCELKVGPGELVYTASDLDFESALAAVREFLQSVVNEVAAVPDQIRSFGT